MLKPSEDPRPAQRSSITADGAPRTAAGWIELQGKHNLIVPAANKTYEQTGVWGGKKHSFSISFTRQLVDHLRAIDARIDLDTGELVKKDGTREDYTARPQYPGRNPPGWLLTRPRYDDIYGLPREKVEVGIDPASGKLTFDFGSKLFLDFEVLVDKMEPSPAWSEEALRPAPELKFERREVIPGVAINATKPELVELAAQLFHEHCGATAAEWPARLAANQAEIKELRQLNAKLRKKKGEQTPELIARAKRAAAPHDRSAWTNDDAYAAVKARIAELKRAARGVELVVVPEGKQWTAMPQVSHRWPHYAAHPRPTKAANAYTATTRYVFLPEEDLRAEKQTSKHELNHLVFSRLDRKTQLEIRAIYDRLKAAKGPFARAYGAQFSEFYTTYGEIFEGRHGAAALLRFRDEVADLYEIFCAVRQRRPA